ncbi:hypothetical protein HNQ80_004348 [Anaerosolibacter carboniphilus]|uniref:PcfK-like protein n=1 Tax=Anaerosolibacter carboniphilus TaxID=1417629 RepID=A0A841L0U2_9FIRM|nr:Cas9 inhibitor AcrIIA9 family protein [Anaerosolibacter carboniphilus]MBB6218208.1 hypothetical protein [Anaerosolibacter carboniphilus]
MLEKAISKLRTEMGQNNANPYIQVVGQFLLSHLESNPDTAEKIMNSEKTIAKSLSEMEKEAKKKKVGNCAVLTDQEGFGIVLKYFGIEGQVVNRPIEIKAVEANMAEPTAKKATTDFDVKLEDFLV